MKALRAITRKTWFWILVIMILAAAFIGTDGHIRQCTGYLLIAASFAGCILTNNPQTKKPAPSSHDTR